MTIGFIIGEYLTKLVSSLGITLVLVLSTILFYEGIPFLNWWPLNKVPAIGWLVEGEVNRHSKVVVETAVEGERKIWVEMARRSLDEYNKVIEQKNFAITNITRQGLVTEQLMRDEHAEIVGKLNQAITSSGQEKENETTINPLQLRIPPSVYDSIN